MRTHGWADDEELATDITAGLQSSFFGTFLTELDEERDWMRIAIVSAGADGDLERAYTQGRHHFRIEGNQWDLIDARLLAEFRLEYLP
jgi:hypothetical protein